MPPKRLSATSWPFLEERLEFFAADYKRFGGHTLIEYLLLGIWPFNIFFHFCNTLEPNLRREPRIIHCVPGHAVCLAVIHRWGLC